MCTFYFMSFFKSLQFHGETLEYLVTQSWQRSQALADKIRESHEIPPDSERWLILSVADDIDRLHMSANTLAAGAILILDEMVQVLAAKLNFTTLRTDLKVGPIVAGSQVHVTSLLAATGNNIRHHSEWARRIKWPYTASTRAANSREFKSIDPLMNALHLNLPIGGCVAADALGRISLGSYSHLEQQMVQIAEAMAAENGPAHTAALMVGRQFLVNLNGAAKPPRTHEDDTRA
jgi:hypothetical protein